MNGHRATAVASPFRATTTDSVFCPDRSGSNLGQDAKLALQEVHYPVDRVTILSGAFKDTVMSTCIVVYSLNGFPGGAQPSLKIARHLDVRKLGTPVREAVVRTMQNQERHFELWGEAPKLTWIASRVKYGSLHISPSEDVIQSGSATARMPDDADRVWKYLRQTPHCLNQCVHRSQGVLTRRIGARRCIRASNWGDEPGTLTATSFKPAGGDSY